MRQLTRSPSITRLHTSSRTHAFTKALHTYTLQIANAHTHTHTPHRKEDSHPLSVARDLTPCRQKQHARLVYTFQVESIPMLYIAHTLAHNPTDKATVKPYVITRVRTQLHPLDLHSGIVCVFVCKCLCVCVSEVCLEVCHT